jgi:DNA mismatch endonuclease (patch repair protein)
MRHWLLADIVSPEKRSQIMSRIRSKDTKPELLIRKGLHAMGFRFRVHDKRLPGTPDLFFPRYNAVIFVHGCFWHHHGCHMFKWPATRPEFWRNKITKNAEKDLKVIEALEKEGWRVLIIWECALRGKGKMLLENLLDAAASWLESDIKTTHLRGKSC